MKHIVYSFIALSLLFISHEMKAQTSAGSCWYLDYDLWVEAEYPDIHGNCGVSSAFNPGEEMTMEVWVRSYTFGLNMKVFGMTSTSFSEGYIMGFENMHPYAQIFNPDNQEVPRNGNGPMPQDSAWVHLATSYSSNGQMINYLNGEAVGSTAVFPQNPVAAASEPFIIGRAPWDFSWAFNGDIDEVRVWNTERSQAEIQALMYKELQGDEPGLIAYYNFNTPADEVFYDKTANGNDGIINNYQEECFWWAESFAPVGDAAMYDQTDVQAVWFGKSPEQYNYAVTTNGLSIIAGGIAEKQFRKYLVFGHDALSGVTDENAPLGAPADFMRTERSWYVNKGGSFGSQCVFNLEQAAGSGEQLTGSDDPIYYTLLFRSLESDDFEALHCANEVNGNYIIFNNIQLADGYYAIGHCSEQLANPSTRSESIAEHKMRIYPNPTHGLIKTEHVEDAKLTVFDLSGRTVYAQEITSDKPSVDLSHLPKGIYITVLSNAQERISQKLILY